MSCFMFNMSTCMIGMHVNKVDSGREVILLQHILD